MAGEDAATQGVMQEASRILVSFMEGKAQQPNAEQQLLELYNGNPNAISKVFAAKANIVLTMAGSVSLQRALRAGTALVAMAAGLDRAVVGDSSQKKGGNVRDKHPLCHNLMDAVIEMTGGPSQAPKDKNQRMQAVAFMEALASEVQDHGEAVATLLEYAEDKVTGIREKAVLGLGHLKGDAKVEMGFMTRAIDASKEVRAAAVTSINPTGPNAATLLGRLDDTEACVREQLFLTLATQPEAVKSLSPGILPRLIVGLQDRDRTVRDAAKKAVSTWVEHLGGPLQLLSRCDVLEDETLGEDCAAQIAAHFHADCTDVATEWLRSSAKSTFAFMKKSDEETHETQAALLSRFTFSFMSEDDRDNTVDIPALLRKTQLALKTAVSSPSKNDFLLRQLLHIVAVIDMCDEGSRRQVASLVVDVLSNAPVSDSAPVPESLSGIVRTIHTTIDLGILLLRKCFGIDKHTRRNQVQENQCSERIVSLIGEICKSSNAEGDSSAVPQLSALSQDIENIASEVNELQARKVPLQAQKDAAVSAEDFEAAHKCKEELNALEAEIAPLQEEQNGLLAQRTNICQRVLAIISTLLRWTNSDIRKDGALLSLLGNVVQPILCMKGLALSEEIELSALRAIGLFSTIDADIANHHWNFFSLLVRNMNELEEAEASGKFNRLKLRRAVLAAMTLSDCARVHGLYQTFDKDQILSVATVLAVVPYEAREVVIRPLCGWFSSFGALYFEEHMTSPLPEITWALGWMLVEAFSHKGQNQSEDVDPIEESSTKSTATDLLMFFNLLAKHPGKHGQPLLCLAAESVCESGLWRRAVNTPTDVHGRSFVRGFSWPKLFEFVHKRLPSEMRLRLWRSCLQVCVASPALAPWAEIPLALAHAATASEAPAGAAELLAAAKEHGADEQALKALTAALPGSSQVAVEKDLLRSAADAQEAERLFVEELVELGVKPEQWQPGEDLQVPKGNPIDAVDGQMRSVAMRAVAKMKREARRAAPATETRKLLEVPTPNRASRGPTSRGTSKPEIRAMPALQSEEMDSELAEPAKILPKKRLHSKTTMRAVARDGGDVN